MKTLAYLTEFMIMFVTQANGLHPKNKEFVKEENNEEDINDNGKENNGNGNGNEENESEEEREINQNTQRLVSYHNSRFFVAYISLSND